jgi:outer membrane lipoprotein-sorting protein
MLTLVLALAAAPAFPFPPSEAEQLLRQVDGTIVAAKTLRIDFEIRKADARPDEGPPLKGFLVLGTGNRVRCDMTGWLTATVVSDGKRLVTVVANPPERKAQAVPEWFGDTLRAWLGRGGTFLATGRLLDYAAGPDAGRPGPADGPRVSNARVLPDERVSGATVRVVEYELAWDGRPATATKARVRVWIDPATRLPVRRTMTFSDGAKAESFTATHTRFEIDPKADDSLFRLPAK